MLVLLLLLLFGCGGGVRHEQISPMEQISPKQISPTEQISPEKLSPIEQIMGGDFSNVVLRDGSEAESFITSLERIYSRSNDELEWLEHDLNGDGTAELLWREKGGLKKILAMFSFEDDNAILFAINTASIRPIHFLSDLGYYVGYTWFFSLYYSYWFEFYRFDEDLNREPICELWVREFYDFSELDEQHMLEHFPHVMENGLGVYYEIVRVNDGVRTRQHISEAEFLAIFAEMLPESDFNRFVVEARGE